MKGGRGTKQAQTLCDLNFLKTERGARRFLGKRIGQTKLSFRAPGKMSHAEDDNPVNCCQAGYCELREQRAKRKSRRDLVKLQE